MHRVYAPCPLLCNVQRKNRLTPHAQHDGVPAVSAEAIGTLIREGGAVALSLVVYSELRAMRVALAQLAARMAPP